VEDIASSSDDSFSLGSFDSILCIHTFEYMVIQKNWADFIEKVLRNVFGLLKDGGIFFFNIGEWYKKFDIETWTYIHFDGKVDFKKEDCLNLWFSKIEELEWNYFVLTK
jgi:cyclopropane fatty-acyl-phospholipid synthase-like methyltransferase